MEHHKLHGTPGASLPPIKVVVCSSENQLGIQIEDLGGGIPFQNQDKIWDYMYTTAGSESKIVTLSEQQIHETMQKPGNQTTPLAGFGVGLPLSKLYAKYLGGSLRLMSMPNYGTHAFLFLDRMSFQETISAELPQADRSIADPKLVALLEAALPEQYIDVVMTKLSEELITLDQLKKFSEVELDQLQLPFGARRMLAEALQLSKRNAQKQSQ